MNPSKLLDFVISCGHHNLVPQINYALCTVKIFHLKMHHSKIYFNSLRFPWSLSSDIRLSI